MDKKLQLIAHLYGEADDASSINDLLKDPELNEEYQQLSEAKFWLDHTTSQKPAPESIAQIMAAAASQAPPTSTTPDLPLAKDRPARPRLRLVAPVLLRIAATVVILVGALFVLWPNDEPLSQQIANMEAKELSADEAPAAPLLDGRINAGAASDLVQAEALDAGLAASNLLDQASTLQADSIPGWDESGDMHSMRKRIEALMQQYDGQNWDNPVVPLEQLPGNAATSLSGRARLQQAGAARRNP